MPLNTLKRMVQLQLVSQVEGAVLGGLNDFQFDLGTRQLYGWRVKDGGMFGRTGGLAAQSLLQVGRDVAFVRTSQDVEWSGAGRNEEAGRAWASAYKGTAVMSRSGQAKGQVQDFVLDDAALRVEALLLNNNTILPLEPRVRLGSSTIVLERDDLVAEVPETSDEDTGWWRRLRSRKPPPG